MKRETDMCTNPIKTILIIVLTLSTASCGKSKTKKAEKPEIVHTAHLAAGWYVQDSDKLSQEIDGYLINAKKAFDVAVQPESIKALIVPHAGYYYSGQCAATAYQTLLNPNASTNRKNKTIKRVIILAPSHTHFFNGISLPYYTAYETVLGKIKVDDDAIKLLSKNDLFKQFEDPHHQEHALEIQLPFLQKTIDDFMIVPLIVGHIKHIPEYYTIAEQLKKIIDDQTLVVVSSDFLHHGPNYDFSLFDKHILHNVRFLDSLALQAITTQSLELFNKVLLETNATICGREPIKILLALIEKQVFGIVESRLSCYYTSAHIPAARQNNSIDCKPLLDNVPDEKCRNSVSYISLLLTTEKFADIKKEKRLTDYEKKALLTLARTTIENEYTNKTNRLQNHLLAPLVSQGVEQKGGVFVTLNTQAGRLRGCIGRILSNDPLYKTVTEMSKSAAFRDSRFSPVAPEELKNLVIDISVLSKPEKVATANDIKIGKHGIILTKVGLNNHPLGSAVFLPQVAGEQGWDLKTTLEHLGQKAGFDKDAWREDCLFEVFEGFEFKE